MTRSKRFITLVIKEISDPHIKFNLSTIVLGSV
jgi:hypothetical protein